MPKSVLESFGNITEGHEMGGTHFLLGKPAFQEKPNIRPKNDAHSGYFVGDIGGSNDNLLGRAGSDSRFNNGRADGSSPFKNGRAGSDSRFKNGRADGSSPFKNGRADGSSPFYQSYDPNASSIYPELFQTEEKIKQQEKRETKDDNQTLTRVYLASLTFVGLFILFRCVTKDIRNVKF